MSQRDWIGVELGAVSVYYEKRPECIKERFKSKCFDRPANYRYSSLKMAPVIDIRALRKSYNDQGYAIIPNFLDPTLISSLRDASERAVSKTRSGDWTYRRIVGRQFPPFDTDEAVPDVWGVQHLMHPDLHEPAFAKWYGSKSLADVASRLMECSEGELQMGNSE